MSDKELIKQEIERRYNCEKCYPLDREANVAAAVLQELLLFIDSLPEESTVKGITWEDVNTLDILINEVRHEFPNGIGEKSFGLAVLEKFQDCQDDIEEPASEGLIEEIDKIWKTCEPIDEGMGVETANIHIEQFDDIARHFAEWQKNQMKETLQTEYEKGRFDMREEMMRDAVEAEVFIDYNINFGYGSLTANIDLDEQHLKEGDKVKIIIVKEEQQ